MRENPIRLENRTALRKALRAMGSATKPALAHAVGLSVVTVGALMNELTESGEAILTAESEMNGGRPAAIYRYNPDLIRTFAAAVRHEAGRDVVQIAVRNADFETQWHREQQIEVTGPGFLDPLIDEAASVLGPFRAIAVGVSGEEVEGVMRMSDYPALNGHSLSKHISERFGVPVRVENDVKALLTGYCARFPECRRQTVAAIYVPEEHLPGGAIWEDGHILRGRSGMSGSVVGAPLGIDWAREKGEAFWRDALSRMMLCMLAMANPNRMVIYGKPISDGAIETARAYCAEPQGGLLMPDEICRSDFALDMIEGAAMLAWRLAAPELED